jgi:hypothetical protein
MSVKHAIFNAMMVATLLAFPIQCVIDPSAVNIGAVCIAVTSSLGLLAYIKWTNAADDQPLSTIALLGFCVTTQLGALLVQTAYWTPISYSLYRPLYTFGTLAFYQLIAVLIHAMYRFFWVHRPGEEGVVRGFIRWSGVYRVPPSNGLWFMGFIGLCSFVLSSREGTLARIGSGFNFLAWAPFLLPIFIREVGPTYCNAARNRLFLIFYTGLAVLLGVALNVRVVMLIGLVTVALLYLLVGMRTVGPLQRKSLVKLGGAVLVLAALSVPVADLATSMAIARGSRGRISPVEMIKKTISVYRRPALIAEYRRENSSASRTAPYDEFYIANPLLARFVETKFHDNMLHFASMITSESARDRLWQATLTGTWATVPTPVAKLFGVSMDKSGLVEFSMGDYMVHLTRGLPLGGHKTGSEFAQGAALVGPLFPIIYAIIVLLKFALMDLLQIRDAKGGSRLSPLAMMSLWIYFYRGAVQDSISNEFIFIFRTFGQTLIIYLIVLSIARVLFGRSASSRETAVASAPGWQQAI